MYQEYQLSATVTLNPKFEKTEGVTRYPLASAQKKRMKNSKISVKNNTGVYLNLSK